MCLYTKNKSPKVAEEDIVCYKVVREMNYFNNKDGCRKEYITFIMGSNIPTDVINGEKPYVAKLINNKEGKDIKPIDVIVVWFKNGRENEEPLFFREDFGFTEEYLTKIYSNATLESDTWFIVEGGFIHTYSNKDGLENLNFKSFKKKILVTLIFLNIKRFLNV